MSSREHMQLYLLGIFSAEELLDQDMCKFHLT